MVSKFLLAVSLAGFGAAVVVPREAEAESAGFLSFPITHAKHQFRRLAKRDADAQLFNISSVSYLIELGLGTPAQQVKVAIDTGSDELWVNPQCNDPSLTSDQVTECQQDGQYNPGSSSSVNTSTQTNTIPYGIGQVEIKYVSDDIAVVGTNAKMTGVQFGVAESSSQLNEGILGLGFGKGKNLNYNNFIDELPLQGVANSKAFSVALGNDNADNGGVIIFGGVDTKKYTGKLVSNPILPPQGGDAVYRYWIQMTAVGLTKSGTSKTYGGGDIPIVLDSGSSLAYLPTEVMTQLASDFNAQFDNNSQFYLMSCSALSQNGAVDFAFGSVTIQVPFSEFILQLDANTCALGALPADPTQGTTALLGDSFLRAAYVVFDQTSNTISMAQYSNCGTAEQSIPSGGAAGTASTCSGNSSSNAKNDGAKTGPGSGVWLAVGVVAVLQFLVFAL